nr:hypothetical protein [Tanacetum cinerariifolium]
MFIRAFATLFRQMTRNYFLAYTRTENQQSRDTLIQHMESIKKSIDERALHKREYDSRVNERYMQTKEEKVNTSKALDASLVDTESSRTKAREQDTSNRSRNDAYAADVDIRPIYDEEPIAEVQMTAEINVFAIGQQHVEQTDFNNKGKQEMHADSKYVESLEKEIDELESDKAEFSNMYDTILQECVSNDVMKTQTRAPQLPQTSRYTNPRVSTSTRVIHKTTISRPQFRSTQMNDKVMPNNSHVKDKKTEVEDYASKEFDQIIDFMNASSIKYALTVNPNIYVSCIKQFWSSVLVKKVNDVTRLQALVDRKKVIITEATIREALRLDDAESIDCLPNEEIFTELSRMGTSSVLLWLQLSSAFQQYSSPALAQKVFANMRRVGNGFSGVDTPLFEGMIVAQQDDDVVDEGTASVTVDDVHAAIDEPSIPSPTPTTQPPPSSQDLPSTSQVLPTPPPSSITQLPLPHQKPQPSQPLHDATILMDLLHTLLETCTTLKRRLKHLKQDKIAQSLEITKLKKRVKKLKRRNKLTVSKLRRLQKVGTTQRVDTYKDIVMGDVSKQGVITHIDTDEDVTLKDVVIVAKDVAAVEKDAKIEENADVDELEPAMLKEVVEVVTTAKLITGVVTAAGATITAATTLITAAIITAAPGAARRRKGVVIRDPEETATPSIIIHSKPKSKDKGKGIMVEEPKPLKKQAHIEQDEAYKAAKKQKLDEEVEELKKHLQIVPNDEDDVYTEATPLARKVPIVDYEIYTKNNKPYYKIMRADGS